MQKFDAGYIGLRNGSHEHFHRSSPQGKLLRHASANFRDGKANDRPAMDLLTQR
jgi:hypothetical protein